MAAQLHVSRQAVSKWETGDTEPESGKLIALARTFDVTVDWLLSSDGGMQEKGTASDMPQCLNSSAHKLKKYNPKFKNLRLGYFIYLGCFFLLLLSLMSTRVFWWTSSFWTLGSIMICAMLMGCILFLYGSNMLRPIVRAFRWMCFKKDYETCTDTEIIKNLQAVWTALIGWILGGVLYIGIDAMCYIQSYSVSQSGSGQAMGLLFTVLLNFLIDITIAFFIFLPVIFSLKSRLI